jgi:hypothetical protein
MALLFIEQSCLETSGSLGLIIAVHSGRVGSDPRGLTMNSMGHVICMSPCLFRYRNVTHPSHANRLTSDQFASFYVNDLIEMYMTGLKLNSRTSRCQLYLLHSSTISGRVQQLSLPYGLSAVKSNDCAIIIKPMSERPCCMQWYWIVFWNPHEN